MSQHGTGGGLDRVRFAALADVILPPSGDLPRPSEIGIADHLLDRAFAILPTAGGVVADALARPGDDPRTFLEELRVARPRDFSALVLLAVSAYYLSPRVRDVLGYQGQEALLIDPFELPAYLEDGTLDRVIARGARYRDVE